MNDQPGFLRMLSFPLMDALFGRRSRRFFKGAEIPAGPFKYKSTEDAQPLSELEKAVLLFAMSGNTGWHYLIMHNAHYAPALPNYACAAGGRSFPSAAGIHTSQLFFTDDDGTYMLDTRSALPKGPIDTDKPDTFLTAFRSSVKQLTRERLKLPAKEPHTEGHNIWVANKPGTLLAIPVADAAQHVLAGICYFLQNGYCLYDDINRRSIPGLEKHGNRFDPSNLIPISYLDQYCLMEISAELATSCYAGALTLQAMGLGGWMFDGLNQFSVLGAIEGSPGLGFRYDADERWATPNPTGLGKFFEAFCPPHYPTMRAALDRLEKRKFGEGGPFNKSTDGPWQQSDEIRESGARWDDEFRDCAALQAQYIYDSFGKFPATIPSVVNFICLQAHHLDLNFYRKFFKDGAYLKTHEDHERDWHQ